MTTGAAALWAASSVTTDATLSILAPSSAVTDQELVTGMVTLPLVSAIGSSAGSLGLPPQTFSSAGAVRIGTESIERDIAQVISRAGLQQASFTIIGDRDQVISVTVPPTISLSRLSGDGQVEFSPVTSMGGAEGLLHATAEGTGELAFDVGGRLQPSPAASAGDYAGVLKVTVQYN
ncbi:DUF4402 domain-containing protein [Sphingomonas sp. Root710]|uniref:DUF4402 domain-containing protein n=1 Tax=Sphingomonas sp. Root710 TaxID=1736594 RepID=UPI00138F1B39|nr:DUF4402 domain-containing protein [Sphingomonas sp. Root710]